ncbi:MAG TPA: GTP-binding protein [Bacilli bacterium]
MQKIPVVVLSGFLGSGKTTLLLRLLQEAHKRGLTSAVLMNELGKNDVDGHLIMNFMPELIVDKLLDGCICCSKKSEVTGCIENQLLQNPDVIFIELTGVANPEEIVDCLTEPSIRNKVYLKQIITLLDAENLLDYNSIFSSDKQLVHTLRRQIEVADLLLINKMDLITPAIAAKIEKALRKLNAQSKLLFTTQSNIEMEGIFAGLEPLLKQAPIKQSPFHVLKPEPKPGHSHHTHEAHHSGEQQVEMSYSRVQTLTLPMAQTYATSSSRIEKFLKTWGSQLLRAKGYLSVTNSKGVFLMQFAAKRITWEPVDYMGEQYVVMIGIDLDTQKIHHEWAKISK